MSTVLIWILALVALIAVLGFGWIAAPLIVLALIGLVWLGARAYRARTGAPAEPLGPRR